MPLQRGGVRRVDFRSGNPVGRVVPTLVEHRRVRRDCVFNVRYRRQRFVGHVDQLDRLLGDVRAASGHRCDRMPLVQRLPLGEDGVRPVAAPALHRSRGRQIVPGNHRVNAWETLRAARVDRHHPRVGVRAAQHLAVQQPVQVDVRAEQRLPRDLLDAVVPHGARADDLEFCLFSLCCRHWSPAIRLFRPSGRGASELTEAELVTEFRESRLTSALPFKIVKTLGERHVEAQRRKFLVQGSVAAMLG